MKLNPVHAAAVYSRPQAMPHAVRFGQTVYTGEVLPKSEAGSVVGPHDAVRQAQQAFENLRLVLAAAGSEMEHVAKLTLYIDPTAGRQLKSIYAIRDTFLKQNHQAGSVIPVKLAEPEVLLAIEAIAHINVAKQTISADPSSATKSEWPDALRAGNHLYASARYGIGETFAQQARSVYDAFDSVITAAGISWRDVVRIHQFATRPDIVFDETRAARAPYLRNEEFLSTSVVCEPTEIPGAAEDWQLVVDIEAVLGNRSYSSTPGIWSNPGGLHIVKSSDTAYFIPQMSRTADGDTLFRDDPQRHADLVCRNLDAMMQSAKLSWANIAHARTLCRSRQHSSVARAVLDRWLEGNPCARTELVIGFFNPSANIEIELTGTA